MDQEAEEYRWFRAGSLAMTFMDHPRGRERENKGHMMGMRKSSTLEVERKQACFSARALDHPLIERVF